MKRVGQELDRYVLWGVNRLTETLVSGSPRHGLERRGRQGQQWRLATALLNWNMRTTLLSPEVRDESVDCFFVGRISDFGVTCNTSEIAPTQALCILNSSPITISPFGDLDRILMSYHLL
jgi:hypothetical protein